MAEHFIGLWVETDEDPSELDIEGYLQDQGIKTNFKQVRTFPWSDVHHEITWWITRPLTIDEWIELDDEESNVLSRIVGNEHFMGTAGPIPELGNNKE